MKKAILSLLLIFIPLFQLNAQTSEQDKEKDLEQRIETLEKESSFLKKFKLSGYIQAQYQHGQENASDHFGIRRGRLKFMFNDDLLSAVFQIDLTEKGIDVKDAYLTVQEPWLNVFSLQAGVFNRPFGYEIAYSSSRRESPERAKVFKTLFPDERDLGLMLSLQAPESSPWNILKLEAGLFAGNGINEETDSCKDFIGHLSVNKKLNNNFSFGVGVSYYHGGVYQGTQNIYKVNDKHFVLNDDVSNLGKYAKREYIGLDAQLTINSELGKSRLHAEYLTGKQPGTSNSSKSPNASTLPEGDTYLRNFQGGYVMFVQEIAKSPFSLVLKYDCYDPNTDVSGNEVGKNNTSSADLTTTAWGFGALWDIMDNLCLQAYYEINDNEKTNNIAGYNKNRKDNVFTLRLQYKF